MAEFNTDDATVYGLQRSSIRTAFCFTGWAIFMKCFLTMRLTASRELEITLTGKNCGQEERAPMCGDSVSCSGFLSEPNWSTRAIRWRSANRWRIRSLPRALSKREVIRIVTPGTNLNIDVIG